MLTGLSEADDDTTFQSRAIPEVTLPTASQRHSGIYDIQKLGVLSENMEAHSSKPQVDPIKMFILLALTRSSTGNTSCSKLTC